MLVDSHCHLNLLDLNEFDQDLNLVIEQAHANDIEHMLCVCVALDDVPILYEIAERYSDVSISVGVHPNTEMDDEPDAAHLDRLARHPSCIAIGETGLDYYRTETDTARQLQRSRFREHIRGALMSSKPLITRCSAFPMNAAPSVQLVNISVNVRELINSPPAESPQ